ncbi:MAG: hypothetical protein ACI8RZ_001231 [Myxococcota bacterium]|jgi:hypothetical protein
MLILVLTVLCAVPTISLPFMMDDWFHISALDGWLGLERPRIPDYFDDWREPWGGPTCFAFFPGGEDNARYIADALVPWWTSIDLRIQFFRPLTSLTHLLDHRLFDTRPLGHHLHSVLWYVGLVGAVTLLYRRILPGSVGVMAAVIFAIDEGHWFPTAWIANRNALIAALPAVLGLLAHIRWQSSGWRAGLPLSLLGLAVGLTGGEAALGVFALLAAYQLLGAPGPLPRRLLGLLPAVLLGVAWAGMYRALGYGAHGSGLYIDPGVDPGAFAAVAPVRALVLLGGQVLGLPADAFFFAPAMKVGLVLGGGVAAVVLVVALRWAWPNLSEPERGHLRWLIPGGLLAMIPGLATFPVNRMLLVPGIGLGVATAAVFVVAWRKRRWGLVVLIALPHLITPLPMWCGMTAATHHIDRIIPDLIARMEVDPTRDAIALFTPDPAVAIYLSVMQAHTGQPIATRWQPMSMAPFDHRLTRLSERTFRLEVLGGVMGDRPFEALFRSFEASPMLEGDRIVSGRLAVVVEEVDAGRPTTIRIELEAPIAEYALVVWTDGTLKEIPPPDIGQSITVAHEPGPMGL